MTRARTVLRYQLSDVLRRRWIIGYGFLFVIATEALVWLGGGGVRAAASLLDAVLLIVPLVAILFATLYVYNTQGFLELLLSQPVSRRDLFIGTWGGLVIPLAGAFLVGTGAPLALSGIAPAVALALLGSGVALTIVFVATGLLIAAIVPDRIKGLGVALGLWLIMTTLFDGLVLVVVAALGSRAAAGPVLTVLALNPIDLARLLLLTQLDAPALMGFTDAAAQRLLGGTTGAIAAASLLVAWCIIPTALGRRAFERRDW